MDEASDGNLMARATGEDPSGGDQGPQSEVQPLEAFFDALPDEAWMKDARGRYVLVNERFARTLGCSREEMIGRTDAEIFGEEVARPFDAADQRTLLEGARTTREHPGAGPRDGDRRYETIRAPVRSRDGTVVGLVGISRDVTEHRRREEAERRLADVLEATPDVVAIRDADGHLLYTNRKGRDWGPVERDPGSWRAVFAAGHPEWAAELVDEVGLPTALAEGSWTGETAIIDADGQEVPISQVIVAGRDEAGAVTHISTIMRDISAIRAREEALRRRDTILEAVSQTGTEFLRVADWQRGADAGLARLGEATDVSRLSVLRLDRSREGDYFATLVLEWTAEGIPAMIDDPLLQNVPAEAVGMSRWIERFEAGETVYGPVSELPESERELLREQEILSVAAVPIEIRDNLWGMLVFDDCVTEREWTPIEIEALRAAAGALGAAVQRRETEAELAERNEELRQSQKMEAIGRLAGGVAHDFNNMLTAIQGFATVLQDEIGDGGRGHEYLDEILRAADRSAALTRQLLAFSRKQVMRPKVIDLNTVIADMETMLRRLLGETITLGTSLADELGPVKVDPGQIEQVIMNLCVNARDAMPGGGVLEIGTRDVHVNGEQLSTHDGPLESGDYVMLTVVDSGVGLDPDTRDRIFEPFFTTKGTGEGTGLGLATVYGIVSQSGGGIAVESEPGGGATFRIYLPRCEQPGPETSETSGTDAAGPSDTDRDTGGDTAARGTETVVVVEDEIAVRRLIAGVLERSGYTVLSAGTGPEALAVLEGHGGPVHLLLTDVVMPEMGGPELARILRERQPDLRVCFMSGYTEDEIFRHGVETTGKAFLEKPFTPSELNERVAAILSDPA